MIPTTATIPAPALAAPALADRFVAFLHDYKPDADLFATDVVVECNFPHVRFALHGLQEMLDLLLGDAPHGSERVDGVRVDATPTGFLVEFEQTIAGPLVFQELVRADVENGRIAKLAWYCTGVLRG